MDVLRLPRRSPLALAFTLALLVLPRPAWAQRDLYWADLDVDATLTADGALRITETHTMVFTGDWNGGERIFNVRPRQSIALIELARSVNGGWRALTEDDGLDDRDEYAWADRQTLRWRSRLPADAPFRNQPIRYRLRYELRHVLVESGGTYQLDHDFLFPDRTGTVQQFTLQLRLDPAWQALSPIRPSYEAERIAPGNGFVLTIPLRHVGAGTPQVLDNSRPAIVAGAVASLLGLSALLVMWLFVGEQRMGRFVPLHRNVDDEWLRAHVFKHPAEVVGAAWDEDIGTPEVVALIARMVSEGKLASDATSKSSMALTLEVDRGTLAGHERALVDGLFFDGRTSTSTEAVKQHYRKQGFRPASLIKADLQTAVDQAFPPGRPPRRIRFLGGLLAAVGVICLVLDVLVSGGGSSRAVVIGIISLVLLGAGAAAGAAFHQHIEWGRRQALWSLTPAAIAVAGATWYLWMRIGRGEIDGIAFLVIATASLGLLVVHATTTSMRSTRHRGAIAFRKTLASAREFFRTELLTATPRLRDEWMPWILAFDLGPKVDDWSARAAAAGEPHSAQDRRLHREPSSSLTSSATFSGFSGGRSGGAGGGASWSAAASGLAAGVSAPSSSGSSSSSGGSSRGSSSGGSSGGGGGGGW